MHVHTYTPHTTPLTWTSYCVNRTAHTVPVGVRGCAAQVLYDEPTSRVGTHFLEAVVRRCSLPAAGCEAGAGSLASSMAGSSARGNSSLVRDQSCRRRGDPTA